MRWMRLLSAALAVAMLLGGCTRTLWVREAKEGTTLFGNRKTAKLKGVPFYGKTGRYLQTTTYPVSWKKVTLERVETVTPANGEPISIKWDPMTKLVGSDGEDALAKLKEVLLEANIQGAQPSPNLVLRRFRAIPELVPAKVQPGLPTANVLRREVIVDYDREMYLNGPLPWFGTSNTTAKLSSEGTLTEASADVETKLAEGIATLFPVKEILQGVAASQGLPVPMVRNLTGLQEDQLEGGAGDKADRRVHFRLMIETETLFYDFTAEYASDPRQGSPPTLEALDFDVADGTFSTRTPEAKKEPAKDEGKKITVSGDIVLPKDTPPK